MMFKARAVVLSCVLTLALGFAAACNMYETDKANKLVDAANASIKDANDKANTGTTKLQEMETAVPQIEDEQELEKWRTEAKAIIANLEKARDGYTDAGNKFTEASKLKLQDKFKEYLDFKGKEMKKRGEMTDALIGEPRALIDGDYQKKVADVTTKFQSLKKEAEDLESKADKILEENKAMFKQS
jgi:F0F1-type ATP synthase membrane subunit b/b'